jgi:phosphatidylserine/phosphatidylglycerophosphate/cardiolipin synthase-like enzyme
MMNVKSLALMIVVLLVGLILGAGIDASTSSSKIASLENQVSTLQGQLVALTNSNMALNSSNIALQDEVSHYQAQIVTLQGQINSLQNTSKVSGNIELLGVYFSPKGGCEAQVVGWINRANSSVHILIYSFTLSDIGSAILNEYRKGIDVKVVFDRTQISKYSEIFPLEDAGVPVRNDTNTALMHEKVAIIDDKIVLVGSFNWSSEAENSNNDNLLVIYSPSLATAFEREFQRIWTNGK